MSDETVLDMSLDTQTELPADFTCSCEILILSPHLVKLPDKFLYENRYVKTLNMSKCINITILPHGFCKNSNVEHIIWPPNITNIQYDCLWENYSIQIVDLSYCIQLTNIDDFFCNVVDIIDILLPISLKNITYGFCRFTGNVKSLDISHCINLTHIGEFFFSDTHIKYIKFPKSLRKILNGIAYGSNAKELDFSECKDVLISTLGMSRVETLKIYSIDNIETTNIIHCKDLHILAITETKELDLSFIGDLNNVYLPEGEYRIVINNNRPSYWGIKFWLGDTSYPAEHFINLQLYEHEYAHIPVSKLVIVDSQLGTI
jgi:hypothetical protein